MPSKTEVVVVIAALFGIAAAGTLGSCYSGTSGAGGCASDEDCSGNAVCNGGFCVRPRDALAGCSDKDDDGYYVGEGCGEATDCNDENPNAHPGATERCDGADNDCDGSVDESGSDLLGGEFAYRDEDGDGFGVESDRTSYCPDKSVPEGYAPEAGDCDDSDEMVNPEAPEQCNGEDDNCNGVVDDDVEQMTWYRDGDGDGFGDPERTRTDCQKPGDVWIDTAGDCDDSDDSVNPDATEICDDIDNDCDGSVDEGCDRDEDGYCDKDKSVVGEPEVCPKSPADTADDCDDRNDRINPGVTTEGQSEEAVNLCNGIDDDCDGTVDEGCPGCSFGSGDGVCANGIPTSDDDEDTCEPPSTYQSGEESLCDGLDNDCDGETDEGVTTEFYKDEDGDGYGTSDTTKDACTAPEGFVANDDDCKDGNQNINPDVAEQCGDDIDNDCDGLVDEGCPCDYDGPSGDPGTGVCQGGGVKADENGDETVECTAPANYEEDESTCDGRDNDCDGNTDEGLKTTYYVDGDGDGFGKKGASGDEKVEACTAPEGFVADNTDCDDETESIKPTAAESCGNTVDDDCDGLVNEGCPCDYKDKSDGVCKDGGTLADTNQDGEVECTEPDSYESPNEKTCDGRDNDCDGNVDNGVINTYYHDNDGDGYGDPGDPTEACSPPDGYVTNDRDCDDGTDTITLPETFYHDSDGDGYGDPDDKEKACPGEQSADYISTGGDCNDNKGFVNPGAAPKEPMSGCFADDDGDGWGDKTNSRPDGAMAGSDCNDDNQNINPEATEVCDNADNDCDGDTDEGVKTTYYHDSDDDGYGDPTVTEEVCAGNQSAGYILQAGDCNDDKFFIHPNAAEDDPDLSASDCSKDADRDGYGDDTSGQEFEPGSDCNDDPNNAGSFTYPGAADKEGTSGCFKDLDLDGWGDSNHTEGADGDDCDDGDADQNPGAAEICNGQDMDCDSDGIDEGCDDDGDGFCDGSMECTSGADCNCRPDCVDDPGVNPDAEFIYPGAAPNDTVLQNPETACAKDKDGDGHGDDTSPNGNYKTGDDCYDADPGTTDAEFAYGGAAEHDTTNCGMDADQDGWADDSGSNIDGDIDNGGDCDDADSTVNPDAAEVCNNTDDDCDDSTDEGLSGTTAPGNACSYDCDCRSGSVCDADGDGTKECAHRIFASSEQVDGDFDTLSGMDDFCGRLANEAGRGGTWKAVASSSNQSASGRTSLGAEVVNFAGDIVDSNENLWDGIEAAVQYDASGNDLSGSGVGVWTGTNAGGDSTGTHCSDWSDDSGGSDGDLGDLSETTDAWIASGNSNNCNAETRVYCIDQ